MNLVEKYLGEGKLSWEKVNQLAKKFSGSLDKKAESEKGKPWATWNFKDMDNYRKFTKVLQSSYMNIKAEDDEDKNIFKVKVWF